MASSRWDPFKDLNVLQERMNRLFDEAGQGWRGDGPSASTTWSPAVDIYETATEVVVKAEVPGISAKDITLHLENNVLTLKGERKFEKETKEENYHRIERAYGSFNRSFSVPMAVDENKIRADFKEGVLTVTLPKKEPVRAKQIQINE